MRTDLRMTVLVLTMNRPKQVSGCVVSIIRQLRPADRLYVLDQCLTDCDCALEIADSLGGADERLTLEKRSDLTGTSQARNYALENVETKLAAFFDDDAILLPECLERLRSTLSNSDVIAAGVVQSGLNNSLWYWWYKLFWRGRLRDQRQELNFAPERHPLVVFDSPLPGGGCAFFTDPARRAGFDERLIRYSMGEDVEFSNRLKLLGRTCLVSDARILHERAAENRDRTPTTELRDAVTSCHYVFSRLPHRQRGDALVYVWAQFSLLLRALITSIRRRSAGPVSGFSQGWISICRGLKGLPYLAEETTMTAKKR
jgi:GT2 family glycosyltransferase